MKVALALVALALAFALGRFTSGSSKLGMGPDVVINPKSGLLGERSPSSETEADQSGNDEMLTTEEEESVSANDNLSAADLVAEKDPIRRTEILAALLGSLTSENER
jgi:hypothetical protein